MRHARWAGIRRAAFLAVALALLGAGLRAGRAGAQETTPTSTFKAPWDTTGAAAESLRAATEVADSLAKLSNPFAQAPRDTSGASFHYTSNYNINRNLATWGQNLNVDARWNFLHIDDVTSINFREDSQRHQRSGQRHTTLKLNYVGQHAYTFGVTADLERDNDGPVVGGHVNTTSSLDNTGLRFTAGDSLYLTPVNFFAFGAEGGSVAHDENTGSKRNSSGSDLLQHVEWTYIPTGPIQLQFSMNNNTSSNTEQGVGQRPATDGSIVNYDTTTSNQNRNFNVTGQAHYNIPWHNIGGQVTVNHVSSQQQQPTLGVQETLTQNGDNVDGTLGATLLPTLKFNMTLHADSNVVLSNVDASRNYNTRTKNATANLNYEDGRVGTVTAAMTLKKSTNDFRKRLNGNLQDVDEHELTSTLHRPLGDKFDLQLNASGHLTQTRYDGLVPGQQDQDYLNRRLGGSLNYTPKDLPITMNFQASQVLTHFVFLDGHQSNKNSTDQLYSVEYDIAYHHGTGLRVTQSYLISADASIADFSVPGAAQNLYTKTITYITNITQPIATSTTLDVNHSLRLTSTGSFDLDPILNQRLFGESGKNQSNDLTVKVTYKLSSWASAFVSNRAQFVHQDAIGTGGVVKPSNRERLLEFNAGLNMTYDLTRWGKLNGNFSRSARLDRLTNFVNGSASPPRDVNQDYFLISASLDLKL